MALCLGVHTGLVVLGTPSDAAPVAVIVGDTVPLALALQQAAVPEAILCSDATARLVRGEVDLEFQGAVLERRHGRGAILAYQVRGLLPQFRKGHQENARGDWPHAGDTL